MSIGNLPSSLPLLYPADVGGQRRRFGDVGDREPEHDRSELLSLLRPHDPHLDQLEQRQERHDHFAARRLGLEQRDELDLVAEREARQDALHALGDAQADRGRDLVSTRRHAPAQHVAQRVQQVGEARVAHRRRLRLVGPGRRRRLARGGEHVAGENRALAKRDRDLTEPLVLEELLDERGARILLLAVLVVLRRRQELPALEIRERRRHHEVLAGAVEVQLRQLV